MKRNARVLINSSFDWFGSQLCCCLACSVLFIILQRH